MKRVRTIVMKIPYRLKVKVIFAININCCTIKMHFQVFTNVRTFYTGPYFELNSMKNWGIRKITVLNTVGEF
jgi:hypothetical protein